MFIETVITHWINIKYSHTINYHVPATCKHSQVWRSEAQLAKNHLIRLSSRFQVNVLLIGFELMITCQILDMWFFFLFIPKNNKNRVALLNMYLASFKCVAFKRIFDKNDLGNDDYQAYQENYTMLIMAYQRTSIESWTWCIQPNEKSLMVRLIIQVMVMISDWNLGEKSRSSTDVLCIKFNYQWLILSHISNNYTWSNTKKKRRNVVYIQRKKNICVCTCYFSP